MQLNKGIRVGRSVTVPAVIFFIEFRFERVLFLQQMRERECSQSAVRHSPTNVACANLRHGVV